MNFLRLCRIILLERELGLIIEYGGQIQIGEAIRNLCGSNLEYSCSQSDYEPRSTTGLYFCSPTNCFCVLSHVANVSNIDKFLNEKNDDEIKKATVKALLWSKC